MHVVAVADAAAHRKAYPSDASDEEWAFVLAYLTVCREDAPQRTHDLREVFNAARDMVKTGAPWRWMPGDFPPWPVVYQQTQRWIKAGVFEAMDMMFASSFGWVTIAPPIPRR